MRPNSRECEGGESNPHECYPASTSIYATPTDNPAKSVSRTQVSRRENPGNSPISPSRTIAKNGQNLPLIASGFNRPFAGPRPYCGTVPLTACAGRSHAGQSGLAASTVYRVPACSSFTGASRPNSLRRLSLTARRFFCLAAAAHCVRLRPREKFVQRKTLAILVGGCLLWGGISLVRQTVSVRPVRPAVAPAVASPWSAARICDLVASLPTEKPYHAFPNNPGMYGCNSKYHAIPTAPNLEHNAVYSVAGSTAHQADRAWIRLSVLSAQPRDAALEYLSVTCARLLEPFGESSQRPPLSALRQAISKGAAASWPVADAVAYVEHDPAAMPRWTTIRCGVRREGQRQP